MENWAKWADGARGGGGMLRDSAFLSSHLTNKPWCALTADTHLHTSQRHKWMHGHGDAPPPLHTPTCCHRSYGTHGHKHVFPVQVTLRRATHNYPTETQLTGKSAEFDRTQLRILGNELPRVGWLHSGGPYVGMNMHVNLSHSQQAASRMPKVSSVRSEVLALCWAFGGMYGCVPKAWADWE